MSSRSRRRQDSVETTVRHPPRCQGEQLLDRLSLPRKAECKRQTFCLLALPSCLVAFLPSAFQRRCLCARSAQETISSERKSAAAASISARPRARSTESSLVHEALRSRREVRSRSGFAQTPPSSACDPPGDRDLRPSRAAANPTPGDPKDRRHRLGCVTAHEGLYAGDQLVQHDPERESPTAHRPVRRPPAPATCTSASSAAPPTR